MPAYTGWKQDGGDIHCLGIVEAKDQLTALNHFTGAEIYVYPAHYLPGTHFQFIQPQSSKRVRPHYIAGTNSQFIQPQSSKGDYLNDYGELCKKGQARTFRNLRDAFQWACSKSTGDFVIVGRPIKRVRYGYIYGPQPSRFEPIIQPKVQHVHPEPCR